jgi:hypothetical protein
MLDSHPVILGRDAELAVLSAAAGAAEAGNGAFVLVEGPAGIGKTTLLRMACARAEVPGPRILTARGLALESGFAYGIARQLIEPVRASTGPGEWDELLDGAAELAGRCSTGRRRIIEDDVRADARSLLAGREPRRAPAAGGAVDDAHWADAPSLRVLATSRRVGRAAPCCSPRAAARTSRVRRATRAMHAADAPAARRQDRRARAGPARRAGGPRVPGLPHLPAGTRSCSRSLAPRCVNRAPATR